VESDARVGRRERSAPIALGRNLLFALIVAMCLRGAAIGQGGTGVGLVSAIEGDATVVRNGRNIKVTQAMALETNDKLITAGDGRVTVTFGDNSSLALGPSTSIVINEGVTGATPSAITRVGLLAGQLHSIINAGLRASGGSYEVHTPNAIAGVRGTDFKIAYIAGKPCPGFPNCLRYTDVGVLKGRVEVSNPLNPKAAPVIATAGYETTVPCEEPPAVPSPLGMDEMLSPAYR
jgi:hypothetical protein